MSAWASAAVAAEAAACCRLEAPRYWGVAQSRSLRMWMMVEMSRLGRPNLSCSAGLSVPENVPEYTPLPWWCMLSMMAPCRRFSFKIIKKLVITTYEP